MICTKCGNEIKDGTKFCAKCGAPTGQSMQNNGTNVNNVQFTEPLNKVPVNTVPPVHTVPQVNTVPPAQTVAPAKKKGKGGLIALIVVLVTVLVLLLGSVTMFILIRNEVIDVELPEFLASIVEKSDEDEETDEDSDKDEEEEEDKDKDKDKEEDDDDERRATPAPSASPAPSPSAGPSMAPFMDPGIATPGTPTAALVSQYLYPSDTQLITMSDLMMLDQTTVGLVRNEIYARHGYIFQTEPYKSYFESQPWYVPNANFNETMLNPIEKSNKDFIVEYEELMGWR